MNFINEVVNSGVTIILFVVTNPVCVPKNKIFGAKKGVDPYHLDLVLLPLFFE